MDEQNETDKFLEWAFDQSGRNPLAWEHSAADLLSAAEAVKEKVIDFGEGGMHSLAAVQAMLLGFAIECMLKGMYIKTTGNTLTHDGRYQGIPNAGDHQLGQIADAAGYAMSVDERRVLDKLSAFILFAGRYPISTNWRADEAHQRKGWRSEFSEAHSKVGP